MLSTAVCHPPMTMLMFAAHRMLLVAVVAVAALLASPAMSQDPGPYSIFTDTIGSDTLTFPGTEKHP